MSAATHYETLGVADTATDGEIVDAYRTLIRHYHPDRAGEAGATMSQKVNEAYTILRDVDARKVYDRGLARRARTGQPVPDRTSAPSYQPAQSAPQASQQVPAATRPSWKQRNFPPGSARDLTIAAAFFFAGILSSAGLYYYQLLLNPVQDATRDALMAGSSIAQMIVWIGVIAVPFAGWNNNRMILAVPAFFLGGVLAIWGLLSLIFDMMPMHREGGWVPIVTLIFMVLSWWYVALWHASRGGKIEQV
ncbi:J domain-containing protein [Leifsonia sp. Leaf264]|uniref:J domain-containing protein n=1 Tax=Leifsonia sp. Leaf264 TaxID=1736314 RepID=UPI0006F4FBE1|nr:J domain-containing protein [Leifsonia sp. Leaf264]KQO98297.1 hypothetical protein ASF30_09565 [Leifsonia sp. Leaf264]